MTNRTLDTEIRLIELVDAWGADPALWPEQPGDSALSILAAPGPRLAAALADARALDEALADLPMVPVPAGLERAILAAAPKPAPPRGASLWQWPARLFAGTGAAMASLVLGVSIGLAGAAPAQASLQEPDGAVYAALGLDAYSLDIAEDLE